MQTVFLRRIGPHNTLALYWEAVFGYFGVLGHTSLHLYSWDDAVYYIDCIVSQYWAPPLLRSIGKDCILYWVDALYYTDCILTLYWTTIYPMYSCALVASYVTLSSDIDAPIGGIYVFLL